MPLTGFLPINMSREMPGDERRSWR
uniref:Uncharacterized protein n=1 Tax=Rhizophora mucronata TaxID=61149 RepID=A0A2P2IN72_RHIMU